MGIRWGAPYRGNLLWGFYFQLPRNASFLHPIPTFYVICLGNEIKIKPLYMYSNKKFDTALIITVYM